MTKLDHDFLDRHKKMQSKQADFEARILSDSRHSEARLASRHASEIEALRKILLLEEGARLELQAESCIPLPEEKQLFQKQTAQRQTELDLHREAEVALRKEHLEKESILIAESEELRSEMRKREHEMAASMLQNAKVMRESHYEAMSHERGGRADAGESNASLRARLAQTEKEAAEKLRSFQTMMEAAMKKEREELRVEYEQKYSQGR